MTDRATAVVVMAKEPIAGTVKTRLAGVLSGEQSAELYTAFLLDKIEQVKSVAGVTAYLAYSGARSAFADLMDIELIEQRGNDLGERLANVATDLASHHGVLLVDSDTPNLPTSALAEAVAALGTTDVVIGPAWDGGYYLVGMRRPSPDLFAGVSWSTGRVVAQTLRNTRKMSSTVHFLPSWYDVDTPADLSRLARDLANSSSAAPGYPRRTAAFLSRLGDISPEPPRNDLWRTLSSRRVYQNMWTKVDEAVVELPNGHVTLYGVVTCPECVGVVPMLRDGRVLLIRQFRYVAGREMWEIPTGGVAEGESLEEAAQRELAEETSHRAERLEHLSTFHTSKSVMDEVAHIYAGIGLTPEDARPDDTESIEVRAFELTDALNMVATGEIVDSMSVIGLLMTARVMAATESPT